MPTDAAILSGPYYPLTIGSSWTYKVTDPIKGVSTKVITIDAKELVPGGANAAHMAYRHTTMKDKADKTVGWLEAIELPNAGGIVIGNMYERSFKSGTDVVTENDWWEPYRTKFDESAAHTVLNAKWTETYKEFIQLGAAAVKSTTQVQSWQVLAVDESVTVPAGTFKCIKVSHSLGAAGTATTKAFWYARGVGKVLEVGGQKEELTAFTIK